MFDTLKVPILGVVETMSYFMCDGCDKKHFIFNKEGGNRVAAEYGLPMLGQVPMEPKVASSCDNGKPLVVHDADSRSAHEYRDIAGKVAQQLSILSAAQQGAKTEFTIDW